MYILHCANPETCGLVNEQNMYLVDCHLVQRLACLDVTTVIAFRMRLGMYSPSDFTTVNNYHHLTEWKHPGNNISQMIVDAVTFACLDYIGRQQCT